MQAAKRRRVAAPERSQPRGLDMFTRVSKSQVAGKDSLIKISNVELGADSIPGQEDGSNKKRKLVSAKEISEMDLDSPARVKSASSSRIISQKDRPIRPLPATRRSYDPSKIPQTPVKPITSNTSTPTSTPTKGARTLLDKLFLSRTQSSPLASDASELDIDTICDTTIEEPVSNELPEELFDLINLHSAFLTALSLHYAHNGTHTPADLRLLLPNVARAWGKRSVALEDIRRALGVLNSTDAKDDSKAPPKHTSILSLSDYGHGKICIEIRGGVGRSVKMAKPLDEQAMNESYTFGLKRLWRKRSNKAGNVKDFINDLPLESITTCASLVKMSPLLAKGQRRLEDLKSGIVLKTKPVNTEGKEIVSIDQQPRHALKRSSTLLERLRAKQLHQSTLPPPPSKAELGRKSALCRLEDVVSVVALLSTSGSAGQQRVSFTVPTLLLKLTDSFKTPISKDEGDVCLKLLASEIAPDWIKLVKIGKMDAIVVDRDARPKDGELKERIKGAILK